VAACDIEKSIIFEKTVEITSQCAFRFMCKHAVDNRPTHYIYRGLGDR